MLLTQTPNTPNMPNTPNTPNTPNNFSFSNLNEETAENTDETAIWKILGEWTRVTREGPQKDVLKNHSDDAVFYDVLPPLKVESAAAYRASWDERQPDSQGDMQFELEDLRLASHPIPAAK